MKNWMLAVAGLMVLATGLVSTPAQAYGMNVGVQVAPVFVPRPMPMPYSMAGGSHGFGGGFNYPPPPLRPMCGYPIMRPVPFYPGFAPIVMPCYPRRPRGKSFRLSLNLFGMALRIGSNSYY
jgi:hypothetical protein